MKESDVLALMNDWTPEQLLAIHDFCQMVSDVIWKQHSEPLLEHLNGSRATNNIVCSPDISEYNLSLPFDDELSF